ncbi:unnamed protein product, partial [Brassica oleracea]
RSRRPRRNRSPDEPARASESFASARVRFTRRRRKTSPPPDHRPPPPEYPPSPPVTDTGETDEQE